jgi:hypothetical protein
MLNSESADAGDDFSAAQGQFLRGLGFGGLGLGVWDLEFRVWVTAFVVSWVAGLGFGV